MITGLLDPIADIFSVLILAEYLLKCIALHCGPAMAFPKFMSNYYEKSIKVSVPFLY